MHRSLLASFVVLGACVLVASPARAQTLDALREPCVHPGTPAAETVPTRILDVAARHPTQTLANPSRPGVDTPLTLLAFGDSAMWGNGLDADHKYVDLVAQYVADGTGRAVHLVTYAHSGANIADESNSCYEPLLASDKRPPGDLNAGLPTTLQQEAAAAAVKDYQDAELVLLDGCINDVSAERVALPFPLGGADKEEITRRAHHWCSDSMLTLLQHAKAHFPHATLIVSNYWLIISDKSSPVGLALTKKRSVFTPEESASYRDLENLIKTQVEAERRLGLHLTDVRSLVEPTEILQKWSDNSYAFLDTSERCFDWAVASVDGRTQSANDPNATQCPAADHVKPQAVTGSVRAFLATVSRDPQYSYGTGKASRLWNVPDPHDPDQRYSERGALCQSHYGATHPMDGLICQENPTAHPNVIGADAYEKSITDILAIAWAKPRVSAR
jgi:lysophospholipase L1-like esterase